MQVVDSRLEPFFVELVSWHVGFQLVGQFYKAVVGSFVAQSVDQQVAVGVNSGEGDGDFDILHKRFFILWYAFTTHFGVYFSILSLRWRFLRFLAHFAHM